MAALLGCAVCATGCSTMRSAKGFVTDSAKAVKEAFVPSKSDTLKIDNHVRDKFNADAQPASPVQANDDDRLNKAPVTQTDAPVTDVIDADAAAVAPADMPASVIELNGEWVMVSVYGQDIEGDERPYITFDRTNGMFYSSNGCNIINGIVGGDSSDAAVLTFDNVMSTLRECHDAPYQYVINMALPQVHYYAVARSGDESVLTLSNAARQPVMVLRRSEMSGVNGAWTVNAIDGKAVEAGKITMTIDIPELRVHGNAGCNIINGQLFIDPDKANALQFGQMATTRMTCPDIQLEMDFLLGLESVESFKMLSADAVALYDASGREVMTLQRMQVERD